MSTSHSSMFTHHYAYSRGFMAVERVDDHTVLTITPSIHPNHTLHHQHCAGQHPHSTLHSCRLLLAPPSKRHTTQCTTSALTTCCSARAAITFVHTNGLHTQCHWLAVCTSAILARTSESSHTSLLLETVDDTLQRWHTG